MRAWHVCLAVAVSLAVAAAPAAADPAARDAALKRLRGAAKGASISTHRATGAARFVRLPPDARGLGKPAAATEGGKREQSAAFFREYGAAIGVSDAAGLRHVKTETDEYGETHLTWKQFHGDVPVFAGTVKVHFDDANRLKAVTGTAVPDIEVSTTPSRSRDEAAEIALRWVAADRGAGPAVGIGSTKLWVYREGLAQGLPGDAHLAWEIEVTDGGGVRDLVYVNAHTGKVIDRIAGIQDHDMYRRAYDGAHLPQPPPTYPAAPYWVEHDPFPTASQEANNMIVSSKEMFDLFRNAFKRESFDDAGATMDAIFDRGYSCPNASWNGTFISFCPGTTTDDVTAHEWGHAFTQYTHGLIYAWQPGALNESYSDIWGEVVDFINGRGTDDPPGTSRSAGACSVHSPPQGQLRVNAPASIAGAYVAQSAGFGEPLDETGVTGDVVAVSPANGCGTGPVTPAVDPALNRVALVDRGTCEFSDKVANAQNAGYRAVLIANNAPTGLPGMGAGARAGEVTIPSLGVQQSVGAAIRGALAAGVNVTLRAAPGTDVAYRWLVGEDATAFNGAIRDMWNPACHSNPGKVSDTAFYVCATTDNGGVHTNSGVPNHAFALIVDGGSYNGQAIRGIGLTKAAHVYYRAQTAYQVEDSDFADHASALRASCDDLAGKRLKDLATPSRSREIITAADCAEVAKAIAAVELETPPTFCNFQPILRKTPPPLCGTGTTDTDVHDVRTFRFEDAAEVASWQTSTTTPSATFTPRAWEWTSALPDGRAGAGLFGVDPGIGNCSPTGDESGVLHVDSPEVTLPANAEVAKATFEHWVATELGYDGANVKLSVNGGPWQVVPPSAFTAASGGYNNYNFFLVSGANGNTNPMGCTDPPACTASEPAWTGTDGGNLRGSWGRSILRLTGLASPGDRVRLRFDMGTDGCGGRIGWYVDDVQVFTCAAPPTVP